MNCDKYIEQISAYIDGELDEQSKAELCEHLDCCEKCRNIYDAMRSLCDDAPLLADVQVPDALMTRVMNSIAEKPKIQKVIIPAFFTDWKVYSSLAACLLAVLLIRGGVDKKYYSYTNEDYTYKYESKLENKNQSTEAAENTLSPSPTQSALPVQKPEHNSNEVPVAVTGDVQTYEITPRMLTPEDDGIATASADAGIEAFTPAEEPPAEKQPRIIDHDNASAPAAGGGGGAGNPTVSGGSSGGGGGGATKSAAQAQKSQLLSKYNFSESAEMTEKQIVFKITNSVDKAKAQELFNSNRSGGATAVQNALDSAGISYTKSQTTVYDHTASYNALVRQGNQLKKQLESETDPTRIDALGADLASTADRLEAIRKNCVNIKTILN
ncbi:MAG: zf-HC2 domain-containing protein [Clostridia bacterium]|nr:zf-HC2 domain-containing protein [Clostridia bacterium]